MTTTDSSDSRRLSHHRIDRANILISWEREHPVESSATFGIRVFVSRMAFISPSSLTCVEPISFPKPLPMWIAADFHGKGFHRAAVSPDPVLIASPRMTSSAQP
jgi:hypothetical protein